MGKRLEIDDVEVGQLVACDSCPRRAMLERTGAPESSEQIATATSLGLVNPCNACYLGNRIWKVAEIDTPFVVLELCDSKIKSRKMRDLRTIRLRLVSEKFAKAFRG